MPFHWCPIETEALFMVIAAIPLIGVFFKNMHARFHAKWKTVCRKEECNKDHSTHEKHK